MNPPRSAPSSAAPRAFDPKTLLDPRASLKKKPLAPSKPRFLDGQSPSDREDFAAYANRTNGSASRQSSQQSDAAGHRSSSLIENLHNVEARDERPAKKRKTDSSNDDLRLEQDPNKKQQSSHGRAGGDLGDHLKEQRQQLQQQDAMTGNSGVIDLTGKLFYRINVVIFIY